MIINNTLKNNIDLGFIKIHLYGIIYTIAFLLVYLYTEYNIKKKQIAINDSIGLLGLIFFVSIITARLFYVFAYWGKDYLEVPSEIFKIWNGGMSYHGGLIGAIISVIIYSKIKKLSFRMIADLLALSSPIALFLGKVGHYLNGEMWGKVTDGSWGVIFIKSDENPVPRHPVQLYEAFFEGILLFLVLFFLDGKLAKGQIFSVFLIFSGVFRLLTEFVREPDIQVGYLFSFMTMGQLLSIPVIIAGIITFLVFSEKKQVK